MGIPVNVTLPAWFKTEMEKQTAQLTRIADAVEKVVSEPEIDDAIGAQLTAARDTLAASTDALYGAVEGNTP